MEQIISIVHILCALGIVGLILMQQGKGADVGASFGGGASQTLFGSGGGGNALTKATALLATLFFITSFALAVVAKNSAIDAGIVQLPTIIESQSELQIPAAGTDIPGMPTSGSDIPGAEGSDLPAADIPTE
jgi:preprotein translocase subunit SecG